MSFILSVSEWVVPYWDLGPHMPTSARSASRGRFLCRARGEGLTEQRRLACFTCLLQVVFPLTVLAPSDSFREETKRMSDCFFWGFPAQKIHCSLRLAPTNSWILLLYLFTFHSWSRSHFKALDNTHWCSVIKEISWQAELQSPQRWQTSQWSSS